MIVARGLAAAGGIVLLDQLAKAAVLGFFAADGCATGYRPLTSFFNLVLTCNRGVSFGLFNSIGGDRAGLHDAVVTVLAGLVVLGLIYWLTRVSGRLLGIAIGLIIGGALGNIIDRVRLGGVVDFLDFHIGAWHWPAFNVADSAICIGVAAMVLENLFSPPAVAQRRRDMPR
ncbi:MAG: signal peptidase II [Alphaproteobacteria bacterium]|nr:signal peptidase II [Alphaproteobacteria bacterium]